MKKLVLTVLIVIVGLPILAQEEVHISQTVLAAQGSLDDDDPGKRIIIMPNPEPPPLVGVPAQFGISVAAFKTEEGQLVIIAGAPADYVEGVRTGAVHLIDGWTGDLIRTIPNLAPAPGDGFGLSVAVDKDGNIIVGAPYDDDPDGAGPLPEVVNAGAVFVFDIYGNLIHRIQNPFPAPGDRFGEALAADQYGNIIVGAMCDDDPDGPGPIPWTKDVGAVFVFNGATGALVHTIPSVSAQPWDWFGIAVTALDDEIIIGDPFYLISNEYAGAVRIFDQATGDLWSTWSNPHPPPTGDGSWDVFGARLTVDESRGEIIVGANSDDDPDGPGPSPKVVNAGSVFVLDASTGEILHTIWNPFPDIGDFFGVSVAAAGGKYVIGAADDDDPDGAGPLPEVVNAGAVFVFDAETASLLHTLSNPFPGVGDFYGRSIAIVDDNIIVGAHLDDDPDGAGPISPITDAGAVFVHDASTGERRLTIQSPGGLVPATADRFGSAVVMSSSRIVAGAPSDNLDFDGPGGAEPIVEAGSVYVLDKKGRLLTTIWNPFPGIGDNFGASVAIDKYKNIIVGAPGDNDPDGTGPLPEVVNSGAVFVFDKDGTFLYIIRDPARAIGDGFGASVAVDKYGNIIVGAPSEDIDPDGPAGPIDPITNAGAVFVFDKYGILLYTIENPWPGSPDSFGSSVAVHQHGNIIVGARNDGDPDGPGPAPVAVEAGAAFVFDGMTGELLHILYDPGREPLDRFGASVAVNKHGKIIVGATNKPGGGGGGAVFIFDMETGALLRTIANPYPETGDGFGASVDAPGGKYVIGAPGDNDPDGPGPIPEVIGAGAVFVFDAETAELLGTIENPAPEIGDNFGGSVAAIGGQYVIGASSDDDPDGPGPIAEELNAGAVFLFHGGDDDSNGKLKSLDADEGEFIVTVEYYPNPVSDILTIESNTSDHPSIKITSINGQSVYNGIMEGPTHQIDLSSFQKGLYFITVRSRDYVRTEKIIKL